MTVHSPEEHLESFAIENVLAWMNFETAVLAVRFENVEYRFPAFREFIERSFNEARWTLWPWIEIRPRKRARKCGDILQSKILAGFGDQLHLLHSPGLSRLRIAMHF